MKILLSILILLMSARAQAALFYVGVGGAFQNMFKTTSSADASKSATGTLYLPELSLMVPVDLWIHLLPTLTYTPIANKGNEDVTRRMMTISLPVMIGLTPLTDLKIGPVLMINSIGGPGGSTQMNNGTGTATFYLPSETRSSKTLGMDFGVGFYFAGRLRVDADVMVPEILSSRRSINTMILFSVGVL